ncbi:MAG: Glutamate racemase [Chlamydiales bacterium]|jgi:glutamate racemase|nr:Glutamate racemase [Chlamydiales bacterium]
MDNAIGIFDSGLGGLTVMKALMQLLPNEKLIYFGDTARVPYGNKSLQTIWHYSVENTLFLLQKKVKMIVIACNTASVAAGEQLSTFFKVPVIDVIKPNISYLAQVNIGKKIGVIGTKGTIRSGIYEKFIKQQIPGAEVISAACPLFVPLIEEGFIDKPYAEAIIYDELKPLIDAQVDTLLLACTHYPLIKGTIQKIMGAAVQVIDCTTGCALAVENILLSNHMQCQPLDKPHNNYEFFVSDDPQKFQEMGQMFLGSIIPSVECVKKPF